MYSLFEMDMPEKDSLALAEASFELGKYPDALLECLVRYVAEHPDELKSWYRKMSTEPTPIDNFCFSLHRVGGLCIICVTVL